MARPKLTLPSTRPGASSGSAVLDDLQSGGPGPAAPAAPPGPAPATGQPADGAEVDADGRTSAAEAPGPGAAGGAPEGGSSRPAANSGQRGRKRAAAAARPAAAPAAGPGLALIGSADDFAPPPEPAYQQSPPEEIHPVMRRAAVAEGLAYAAARGKAAARWAVWAGLIADLRRAGISESALATLAAQTGAPLPDPEPARRR